jgi:hypothetical protein
MGDGEQFASSDQKSFGDASPDWVSIVNGLAMVQLLELWVKLCRWRDL